MEAAPHLFQTEPTPTRKKRSASSTILRAQKLPKIAPYSNYAIEDKSSKGTLSFPLHVDGLENTYIAQKPDKDTRYHGQLQRYSGNATTTASLFLAIDGIDEKIEFGQLLCRIYCYVFAELHPKGTSVDPIVRDVHNVVSPTSETKQKVYRFLYIGTKWGEIVNLFASINNVDKYEVLGLLSLLRSGSL